MVNGTNYGWELGYGWLISAIVLAVVIGLIVINVNQKKKQSRLKDKTPMAIIKERYAKGEISKAEFEEKWKAIL